MIAFPPCKINLGLHIIAKRPDGYHDIETCFCPVPWTDILEIIPSDTFQFTMTGLDIEGPLDSNLCVKAYRLMQEKYSIGPVAMHLHKIIPMGAGLGGGSSDAASALVLLNGIFNLNLSVDVLRGHAASLGSDCAFFIDPKPMLGTRRGEVLTPMTIDLGNLFIILVKPDIHVSTAEAYANVKPQHPPRPLQQILQDDRLVWRNTLVNDFEQSVFSRHPGIAAIKKQLYDQGAVYASMSGSGSAVFGLFSSEKDLKEFFPGTIYWSGWLKA
ncbi:MAG: 4-(cytidine 5'-diphospho)-2-C-methyl-D-erythritol kinase [Cyclobacteriaceae bacterium]|jgi:4-diphosphocytidyl-2-C-methyl-D-erythritol kinase|nr:4-(cytidine 5'-diphospho)-2-C-methyl-D-erythritol kinase [Cyclobacteriaceae bacterium]